MTTPAGPTTTTKKRIGSSTVIVTRKTALKTRKTKSKREMKLRAVGERQSGAWDAAGEAGGGAKEGRPLQIQHGDIWKDKSQKAANSKVCAYSFRAVRKMNRNYFIT